MTIREALIQFGYDVSKKHEYYDEPYNQEIAPGFQIIGLSGKVPRGSLLLWCDGTVHPARVHEYGFDIFYVVKSDHVDYGIES